MPKFTIDIVLLLVDHYVVRVVTQILSNFYQLSFDVLIAFPKLIWLLDLDFRSRFFLIEKKNKYIGL